MAEIIHTDICFISSGSGGLFVVAGPVKIKAETVLIERDKMVGDCMNTGCISSKALLTVGNLTMNSYSNKKSDIIFVAVKAHEASLIDSIAAHVSVEGLTDLKVRVSEQFFVITSGAHPCEPPIDSFKTAPFHTNETIFDLQEKASSSYDYRWLPNRY